MSVDRETQQHNVKRTTWVDLSPFDPKKNVLSEKFIEFRERMADNPKTSLIIRELNRLASQKGISKKESLAWYEIKDWIFAQEMIYRNEGDSIETNPERLDTELADYRDRSRLSERFDDWSATQRGIYCRPTFPDPFALLDYHPTEGEIDLARMSKEHPVTEVPGNMESLFAGRLNEIAKIKDGPVVFIDFGGVQSITTLRLAKKFEQQVREGKMVFVVTNLSADKEIVSRLIEAANYGDTEMEWINKALELVHYIKADAEELTSLRLDIPGNDNYQLSGHVDILHESNAVSAHGRSNDRDIPLLARMLSRYGLLATRTTVGSGMTIDSLIAHDDPQKTKNHLMARGYQSTQGMVQDEYTSVPRNNTRLVKQQRAYRSLVKMGLTNIDALPLRNGRAIPLSYSFFLMPDAPALQISDRFGHKYIINQSEVAIAANLNCYKPEEISAAWRLELEEKTR